MENKIQHPTKSEYNRIKDFSNIVIYINSSLAHLNNHIEILKRVGDIDALRAFDTELSDFISGVIYSYCSSLQDKNDED